MTLKFCCIVIFLAFGLCGLLYRFVSIKDCDIICKPLCFDYLNINVLLLRIISCNGMLTVKSIFGSR